MGIEHIVGVHVACQVEELMRNTSPPRSNLGIRRVPLLVLRIREPQFLKQNNKGLLRVLDCLRNQHCLYFFMLGLHLDPATIKKFWVDKMTFSLLIAQTCLLLESPSGICTHCFVVDGVFSLGWKVPNIPSPCIRKTIKFLGR